MTNRFSLPRPHPTVVDSAGERPFSVVGHIAQRPAVVGTGLVALDVIYGLDQTCGPDLYAGGTCGNVLAALAFLGWASYPVARLANDAAGSRVLSDLASCGVRTDFASLDPRRPTPVMLQRIRIDSEGRVVHRFATRCPDCGGFFPQYTPVPREPLGTVTSALPSPEVVFVDRVSPGAVLLAETAYQHGSLIYFEPSAACDARLVARMLAVTHVLKYSQDRSHLFARPSHAVVPLEIETRGSQGLRFRGTMFGAAGRAWRVIPGFVVPQLRDTAGAGDWMSAGLIDFVAQAGAIDFEALPLDVIEEGLRTGQAFSAWTCGFEGARGGMYRESVETVRTTVARTIARGVLDVAPATAGCATPFDVFGELCGGCALGPSARRSTSA
jgi:sugar/nucleoside kinase (ribokinase family)